MSTRPEESVEVVLDIFSGRPNPRWTLSGDRLSDLKAKLHRLPAADEKSRPALGYRGFVLRNVPWDERTKVDVTVFDSIISITREAATGHHADAHGLERWLIDQARQQGHGAAIDHFRSAARGK